MLIMYRSVYNPYHRSMYFNVSVMLITRKRFNTMFFRGKSKWTGIVYGVIITAYFFSAFFRDLCAAMRAPCEFSFLFAVPIFVPTICAIGSSTTRATITKTFDNLTF